MSNAIWLADVLRAAGLTVIEQPGWKTRGRAAMGDVKGVMLHHTGSNPKGGDHPALDLVEKGRAAAPGAPALPGPLSHMLLARNGTVYVVAAGRTNHAGKGAWQGVTDGNEDFLGVEAENNGTGEVWPALQLVAYARLCAAILTHIGADDIMAVGHKEYALPKGRKIDPSFDMLEFRESVEGMMAGIGHGATPRTVDVARAMLRKGDTGDSVLQLQLRLGIHADGSFGPKTYDAVQRFQQSKGLVPDGMVGPKTWAALGVS